MVGKGRGEWSTSPFAQLFELNDDAGAEAPFVNGASSDSGAESLRS